MKRRVTITMDEEVHRTAKREARRARTTVSGLIEDLLRGSAREGDRVSDLIGSASLHDEPGPLEVALRRKYLRD